MWGHRYGGGGQDHGDEPSDWLNAFISPRLPLVDVKYCAAEVSCAQGDFEAASPDSRQGPQGRRECAVDVSVGVKHGENRVVSHLASNLVSRPPLIEWEMGLGPMTVLMMESKRNDMCCSSMSGGSSLCWMVTDAVGSVEAGQTRVQYSGGQNITANSGKHCYIFVLLMQTEPLATIDCLGAATSPPPKGPRDHHHDVASPWGEDAPSDQENQASLYLERAGSLRDARECCQDWNFGEFLRRNPSLVAAAHNYFYASLDGN